MTERSFTAAAAQMTARDDLSVNLDTCRRLAAAAAGRGAQLLVLPECFAFLGRREADKLAVAEALDPERPGPILAALREMAVGHRLWVIGGGLPEKVPGEPDDAPTRTYNTCVVIAPDGAIGAAYRKLHLFDVDIPGGAVLRESDSTARGDQLVVASTPLGRIGLSICYDLRFPELYRDLVCNAGAEVLVVPAAFTAHTGRAHWHTLLRARAIENQCYVIAAAQWGRHNDKRESYGHSLIIDPWGQVTDELAEGDGLVVSHLDLAFLDKTRRQMPCLDHQVLVRE